jgi:phosphoglycolate phosphatase
MVHPLGVVAAQCRAESAQLTGTIGGCGSMVTMQRAVGFDLDMTLVDTRRGIKAALLRLAEETGRPIDADAIVAALGPPIADALSPWFADEELIEAVQTFRRHMAEVGVMNVQPLPGAAAAMNAARAAGLAVVVITSKIEPLALATLRHAELLADRIFGNVWADGKAAPLVTASAICYVGDHPGDMAAASAAGVPGYGVTSGASSRAELLEAGATHVSASLESFPAWLKSRVGSATSTALGRPTSVHVGRIQLGS